MVSSDHFYERRRLAEDGRVLILSAHDSLQQRSDMAYRFVQEANFFYLTGIVEPGWRLVVADGKDTLITPEKDAVHRLFDGGMSPKEAQEISGVDTVLSQEEGRQLIETLAKKHSTVFSLGPDPGARHYDFTQNPALQRLWRSLKKQFKDVEDIRRDLAKLRAIKSPEEIALMRQAIEATCESFARVKNTLSTYRHEYELEAEFTYDFRRQGLAGHAYEPIVASGNNACTLHYNKNNQQLPENGLVLLDIGTTAGGYAADITRTYACGEPTKRQRAVHEAVERAQKAIIALIRPGVKLKDYQEGADDIMKEVLAGLGLLNHPDDYRRYFPHAISHGLGIDVHESLGGYEAFMPGMVLTVEPGIYIPEEGIGVRIEDDILVTDEGNENLSASLSTAL